MTMSTPNSDAPLVGTDWLAERLGSPDMRVFDCTVHLRPAIPGPYVIESGRADYERAHIPGAAFVDLGDELSDTHSELRFTLPSPTVLAAGYAAAGIGSAQTIVLYSSTTPMWATRVWWMLRGAGHARALVLDGGLSKWRAEGRALVSGGSHHPAAEFNATARHAVWADKSEVLAAIGNGDVCTVNALSPALHSGASEVNYGRKGHIAGSVNVPYARLTREDGTFRCAEELSSTFGSVGATMARRVICYCGGGVSATMDALALVLIGHPDVAVYDGSMSEWVRDPTLPMSTGESG
jgi:thiosulfate/3-mercaptopyruvate sulfurtransferase